MLLRRRQRPQRRQDRVRPTWGWPRYRKIGWFATAHAPNRKPALSPIRRHLASPQHISKPLPTADTCMSKSNNC